MTNESYQVTEGTYYRKDTPAAVVEVLEKARKSGLRIRLSYGDTETGRDWLDEFDVEGTISRSMGPIKVPILLVRKTSSGGPALLDHCMVKIRRTGKGGLALYKHPKYQTPSLTVQPSAMPGFEAEVRAEGKVHARFRTAVAGEALDRKNDWLTTIPRLTGKDETMQVQVLVTLEVEETGDTKVSRQDKEDAAAEAVENAVRKAEDMGFNSGMEDELSMLLVDVVPYEGDDDESGLGESENG